MDGAPAPSRLGPPILGSLAMFSSIAGVYLGVVVKIGSAIPLALLSQAFLFAMLGMLTAGGAKELRRLPPWTIGISAGVAYSASITTAVLVSFSGRSMLSDLLAALAMLSLAFLLGATMVASFGMRRQRSGRLTD